MIDIDGQRREDQQELLAANLDGSKSVERVVGYKGDARMLSLYERHWMLVAHQTVHSEARRIAHNKTSVSDHVQTLSRCRK